MARLRLSRHPRSPTLWATRPDPPRGNRPRTREQATRLVLAFRLSPSYRHQLALRPMHFHAVAALTVLATPVFAFPAPSLRALDSPDTLFELPQLYSSDITSRHAPLYDPDRFRALGGPPVQRRQRRTSLLHKVARGIMKLVYNPKFIPNPKFKPPTSPASTSATPSRPSATPTPAPVATGCYPGSNLAIPSTPATASSLAAWWCPHSTEYAIMVRSSPLLRPSQLLPPRALAEPNATSRDFLTIKLPANQHPS